MHLWFWSWVTLVVVFALGETVTGGLYVLPWAAGAAMAAGLEAFGVPVGWQWTAFIVLSSVLLVIAQRTKRRRK